MSSVSIERNVRRASGLSQMVIASVRRPLESASTPTGRRIRRRPMPSAVSAMISLSADILPSPSSTPINVAIGSVNTKTPGRMQTKSLRICAPEPAWRTNSSIKRTSCGTKNTKVKTASPSSAWRKTSRTIYLSRMRMTRTLSVARSRERPAALFAPLLKPASFYSTLPGLDPCGVRPLQVSPTLQNLPVGNPPDHNSREFHPLLCCRVGSGPMIAHHHLVVFGDHVFDGHLEVGYFFERGAEVLDRPRRSRWQSWGDIRSVIHKSRREIHLTDTQVLPVHEFLKMIADEFLHLRLRHASLGILDFRCS